MPATDSLADRPHTHPPSAAPHFPADSAERLPPLKTPDRLCGAQLSPPSAAAECNLFPHLHCCLRAVSPVTRSNQKGPEGVPGPPCVRAGERDPEPWRGLLGESPAWLRSEGTAGRCDPAFSLHNGGHCSATACSEFSTLCHSDSERPQGYT